MKRIFTIITLVIALLAGGVCIEAKTNGKTKTKTNATATPTFAYFDDGCPNPGGHTYVVKNNGKKMNIVFTKSGNVTMSMGAQKVQGAWEYLGDNAVLVYSSFNPSDKLHFIMAPDGKSAQMFDANGNNLTATIVK